MKTIETIFSPKADDLSTQQTLSLIGAAGLVTLLITIIPGLSLLSYPFRLLLTIVHELGHGLAALLTGGEFIRFQISANGSGLAFTSGGWRLVVIPAGYLGVALFGAALIMLGRDHRWSRTAMGLIGGGMILLGLFYAVPTIFTIHILSGILTTFASLAFGALFLWIAFKAPPGGIIFLLHIVAIQAGLTAFTDLFTVIGLSTLFFRAPNNDARSMAELTFIPAIVWAIIWVVAAIVIIGGAIWLTWLRTDEAKTRLTGTLPKRPRL
ncbi:MAG: M50 family metallopeptidase [Anaerolineae bacterium]|nr:M50 family metallopeptidase [Anaerolineae bacterium]